MTKEDASSLNLKINEQQRVVESLTSDFECVNYIDLCTTSSDNAIINYRISKKLEALISGWKEVKNYQQKLNLMAKYAVHPDDKDVFLLTTSNEHISKPIELNAFKETFVKVIKQ